MSLNDFLQDESFLPLARGQGALSADRTVPSAVTSNPAPVNPTRHSTVWRRLKDRKDRASPRFSITSSLSQRVVFDRSPGKAMSGRMPPDASPHTRCISAHLSF